MTLSRPSLRRRAWRGAAAFALAVIAVGPATAQVGSFLGSTDGSYCKLKSRNRIVIDSWLDLAASPDMLHNMTLRRAASLSRSQGFDGFLVPRDARCGIMKQGQRALARRCRLDALLANKPAPDAPASDTMIWLDNAEILARTEAEAATYPVRSGLLARGSACVID